MDLLWHQRFSHIPFHKMRSIPYLSDKSLLNNLSFVQSAQWLDNKDYLFMTISYSLLLLSNLFTLIFGDPITQRHIMGSGIFLL